MVNRIHPKYTIGPSENCDPNAKTTKIKIRFQERDDFTISKPRMWLGIGFLLLGEWILGRWKYRRMTVSDFYSHVQVEPAQNELKSRIVNAIDAHEIGRLTMEQLTHYSIGMIRKVPGLGSNTYGFMVKKAAERGIYLKPWH